MPIGIELLLVLAALVLAIIALARKPTLTASVVLLCLVELLRLYGR